MTNAELQKLKDRSQELTNRYIALTAMDSNPVIDAIIREYTEEVKQLETVIHSKREYMYNFVDGGWNTEYAYTMEEAIEQAKARWVNSPNLQVNPKTFRVTNERELRSAMAMFY
jgi:transcription initiation factor IIE alpha subunit